MWASWLNIQGATQPQSVVQSATENKSVSPQRLTLTGSHPGCAVYEGPGIPGLIGPAAGLSPVGAATKIILQTLPQVVGAPK